ncbi:hypothetical protein [Streptomyces sp. NPDC006551]|uniref:hypothetical protein n=1 Tax=Streptomyces sp. NPDC006551 TaxID=3157178 RepID=UPI0033B27AE5
MTSRQESPTSDPCLRHQSGVCVWKAIFSGGQSLLSVRSLVEGGVGLDEPAVAEDLHHRGGGEDVDAAADQLPRNRVESAADLDVASGPTVAVDQWASTNGVGGRSSGSAA